MKKREYRDFMFDIIGAAEDIESFIKGMTYEEFLLDRKTLNAVIRSLEIIGEATKNLPESLRDKYPVVPWKKMAGMRDKMSHEYFGVNYETVWKTAIKLLPGIKKKITGIINREAP